MKTRLVWFFLVCLLLMSRSALAHKVNIFAYVEGSTIFTESYFQDGRKVKNGKVEVYNSKGIKILEGATDEKGEFNFRCPKKDDLKIVVDASLGHKNFYVLSADEMSNIVGFENVKKQETGLKIVKIIGGIGCIFGLMGIIRYFLVRREL